MATKKAPNNVSARRLISGFAGFSLATVLFVTTVAVAAPTANPPNGNVGPNFSSLSVSGNTNLRGFLYLDPPTAQVGAYMSVTDNRPLIMRSDLEFENGTDIVLGNGSTIYYGATGDSVGITIDDELNVTSGLNVSGASNFSDGNLIFHGRNLDVTSSAAANLVIGTFLKPQANLIFGYSKIDCIADTITIGSTSYPCLRFATNIVTEPGNEIGSYYQVKVRNGSGSIYNDQLVGDRVILTASCESRTYLSGCSGYISDYTGNRMEFLGSEAIGDSCRSYARKKASTTVTSSNFYHYAVATCFDPASLDHEDINTTD